MSRGSFSVMLPAHRDEAVMEARLADLLGSDRPPSEVELVVARGDPATRAAADRFAARHAELVEVVVDSGLFGAMGWESPRVWRRPARVLARALALRPPRGLLLALGAVVTAAVAVAAVAHSASILYLLYIGASLSLGAIAWTTLAWMLDAWRTPAYLDRSRRDASPVEPAHSFSLIVPARHEEAVLEATLSRLVTTNHPAFEVLVVVGTDDPGTREVAERVAERHPERVKVVLDASRPKSKPKALNTALPYCTGTLTGVFDAEDDVHPGLLRRVDQCFQETDADVVQAGVQLMNFRSSWLTVRNVLEYYFWFRSRLHFHARQGFIPLGGNTVFVRTDVLRAVSGWDTECLAEDCELGVRLSALGAHTVVFYDPVLVTREECPPTLAAFARQRTRWNQGYLQTLSRGYWRRLPLRQRALGAYTLAMPYLMAAAWLMVPVALATALVVKAPVPVTLVSFLPALPMLSMLAVEVAGLGEFCREYGERASPRDYARLVLGTLLYQAVLTFAAARAVARELRGHRGWEKTAHLGLHLQRPTHDPSPSTQAAPRRRAAGGRGRLRVAFAEHAAGDGPSEPPRRRAANLFGDVGGPPLWVRLGAVSASGSASLSLPGAVELGAGWLDGARESLRSAVAARADLLLLLVLLAAVGIVQGTNVSHWPATQFDEGTYVYNAWAVEHGALAPYTYSYGHPPLSWLLISLWTWTRGIFADGAYSIDTGRELMLVAGVVSSALVFTLARRLGMARAFAACAVVLFALSPVGLFYHRAVLLDNVAVAWALAAFVLALTPRRRLWAFAGSGACFAASVLSKETILVILPALLLALARNADRHTRRYCLTLFASFLALIGLSYPLYATLKGELLPGSGHVSLVGAAVHQLYAREQTGSVFDPTTETHAAVMRWLELDWWLLGAALALTPVAIARRSTRAIALAFVIQSVMILRPGYLPNMYVIGLLPFAALIVAGGSEALWRMCRDTTRLLPAAIAAVTLALLLALSAPIVATRWTRGAETAMSARHNDPQREAGRWLVHNISRDDRLIVGDEFWLYLVEHGFDDRPMPGGFFSRTVVAYWPLDYDPAVKRQFPNGWRDFDYVVSTQAVRVTTNRTPTTAQAIEHSRLVATFGRGQGRIEVRAITEAQSSG